MFRILSFPIIAGTIACALQTGIGPPALALDRWIELTNNTRMPIVEIYISHARSDGWNIDLPGDDYLAPASSVLVNIDDGAGCRFDFKTVFDDGTIQIRRNVDVCAVEICDLLSITVWVRAARWWTTPFDRTALTP